MLFDEMEENEEDFFEAAEDEEAALTDIPRTPRAQLGIAGHDAVERRLLDLVASERFPSSLIFNGTAGIGKATMAFRLARYLFKYKNDEDDGGGLFGAAEPALAAPTDSLSVPAGDPVYQQVASGGYPDLLVIERAEDDKGKIKNHDLDEVRQVTQFFRRTASQGGWRIAIIDDADTMNWHSQNALLKILEEPPKKSLLILICHRIGALLPTILSRSQIIDFLPLGESDIKQIIGGDLERHEPVMQQLIVRMASGSISRALTYAEGDASEIIAQTMKLLSTWPNFDWSAVQHFADTVGDRKSSDAVQAAFRDTVMHAVYGLARAKSLEQGHELATLLAQKSQGDLLKLCDDLRDHFTQVQVGNLDKRFMVMGAFSLFAR